MKVPTELVRQWDTGLLQNQVFWTAVAANVVAQTVKLLLDYALNRRWDLRRVLDTGGMPSTHSATVSALAIAVAFAEGWDSPLFAVAAIFALVVMYDATGIRRHAGQQAELLNQLVRELQHVFQKGFAPGPLKELLGHSYLEVLLGALIGVLVAWVSFRYF